MADTEGGKKGFNWIGLLILIAVVALNVIVYQQAMEIRSQLTTLNSVAYEVKQRVIGLQVQMDNDSKKGR